MDVDTLDTLGTEIEMGADRSGKNEEKKRNGLSLGEK